MYKYIKRLLDIVLSLILFIILLPLFLVLSLMVLIDSGLPFIYTQKRTGYKGKVFTIYKFRTMSSNKISSLGHFLRRYSLDELPQLINVFKGDMSLIGPRPWIVDYYNNFTKEQKRRVSVRPGITGLTQVKCHNNISVFAKIDMDIEYVDNISFIEDVKICNWSLMILFRRDKYDITNKEINNEINDLKLNKQKDNNNRLDRILNEI